MYMLLSVERSETLCGVVSLQVQNMVEPAAETIEDTFVHTDAHTHPSKGLRLRVLV